MKKPVGINLDAIKKKLEQTSGGNPNLWKPTESETTVRIVPSKYSPGMPFQDLYFHYGILQYGLLSPTSFDRPDPIKESALKLRETGDAQSMELAKKLMPKSRTYVPVIVRGEEKKGVRYWALNWTIYKELLALINDPEYLDISDISTGTDIKVFHKTPAEAGNKFGDTSIRPSRAASALTDDVQLLETWLEDQPQLEGLFEEKSYEELQGILETWLEGGDPNKTDKDAETKADTQVAETKAEAPTKESAGTESEAPAKTVATSNDAVSKEFDKLFDED